MSLIPLWATYERLRREESKVYNDSDLTLFRTAATASAFRAFACEYLDSCEEILGSTSDSHGSSQRPAALGVLLVEHLVGLLCDLGNRASESPLSAASSSVFDNIEGPRGERALTSQPRRGGDSVVLLLLRTFAVALRRLPGGADPFASPELAEALAAALQELLGRARMLLLASNEMLVEEVGSGPTKPTDGLVSGA